MSIGFSQDDWVRTKENYREWWAGDLGRPLIQFTVGGRNPGRSEPSIPAMDFISHYDLSITPEQIVDRWDYNLSSCKFLGDSFPTVWPNFGPGVAAAFMGAELKNDSGTTWFQPVNEVEIADLVLEYDENNFWFRRMSDIYRVAVDKWQGSVQLGMSDLGGNLDVLSSFRPSEKLLFDLYDYPEDVKEKTWDAHRLWCKYFDEFNSIIQPSNPGYTAWAAILSPDTPYYMLQCDFCYMIGPDMFDEFVKPELAETCKKLGNAFYHLDGPGQLPHLDSLLSIEELKGVQWIPGSGVPSWEYWPEVYIKIRDAGKLIQIYGDGNTLDAIYEQTDGYDGIILIGSAADEEDAMKTLEKYKVK